MAELEDAVLPILRDIQADVAELKRGQEQLARRVDVLSNGLDKFETYFTYLLGMTERNRLDIQRLDRDMKAMGSRLDQLEPQT